MSTAPSPSRRRSTDVADWPEFTFRVPIRAHHRGVVRSGLGDLDGRLIGREAAIFTVNPTEHRGALSQADGEAIAATAEMARELRRPLIGVIGSAGADILGGIAALHGWGLAAKAISDCSGMVPIVLVVHGPAVSGVALLLGLADIVVMTDESYAFVSGPAMVADFTGIRVDNDVLGGTATHARHTGLATFSAATIDAALDAAVDALRYLPDHVDAEPEPFVDEFDTQTEADVAALDDIIPPASTGSYDVRAVARGLADDGSLLELRPRWAPNLVTAFASIGGRSVGIVANQPIALAGTLDIPAAQKGAAFVSLCDTFNLPIITLVDTPGYFPGKDLEWRGMIRHGAQMAYAYAEATVPRVCVVLRKAYGGAYIVMDCKTMGNDLCIAWPTAELAVMGAKGAVQILYRRETEERRSELEAEYGEAYLNPFVAAERGYVDMVVAPRETRRLIGRSLDLLSTKREMLTAKRHGNTPL